MEDQKVALSLQGILEKVFEMYMMAHVAHWNVIGPDFPQYHEFFSEIYEDVFGSIDPLAENIRKLGFLVEPINVKPLTDATDDSVEITKALLAANVELEKEYSKTIQGILDNPELQSLVNFLAERLDQHQKWSWQMRSTLGLKESHGYSKRGEAVRIYLDRIAAGR
jgi:starvation-inducible DNA-binding protein